MIVPFFGNI